jgi:hypothetical protein
MTAALAAGVIYQLPSCLPGVNLCAPVFEILLLARRGFIIHQRNSLKVKTRMIQGQQNCQEAAKNHP